jgi:hypothetical protein
MKSSAAMPPIQNATARVRTTVASITTRGTSIPEQEFGGP